MYFIIIICVNVQVSISAMLCCYIHRVKRTLLVTTPSSNYAYPPSSIILPLLHQEPKNLSFLPVHYLHCQSSPSSEKLIPMPNPQISLEEAFSSTSSPPHLSTPRCQPQCDPKTTMQLFLANSLPISTNIGLGYINM